MANYLLNTTWEQNHEASNFFLSKWCHKNYEKFFIKLMPVLSEFVKKGDVLFASTLSSFLCSMLCTVHFKKLLANDFLHEALDCIRANSSQFGKKYYKVNIEHLTCAIHIYFKPFQLVD